MHGRYGGLLRILFEWLFGPIHYPEEQADRIRQMARQGTVVYVARASSTWLALYFNHALHRLGLPLARFVGGLNLWLWQPVDRIWKLLWAQPSRLAQRLRSLYGEAPPNRREELLADIAVQGDAAFLFLRDSKGDGSRRSDYVRALVAAQHLTDRPIFLVPHAMTDRALSGQAKSSLRERLFGTRSRRSRGRQLRRMPIAGARRATVRVGDPLNIQDLMRERPDDDDEMLARRVRHELERRITVEESVVAGPELPAYETVVRHVMRDPLVKAAIAAEVEASGKQEKTVARRARRYVREVAARYSVWILRGLGAAMRWTFSHIYDGIFVDQVGYERVIEASRRGPIIYCPAHRSHADYLVLSLAMWDRGFTPPHIAAGANLSFFPLGTLFRGSGAFFLRRSFKDNPLYASTFRAYVHELVRQGTSIEFFMEGGRSRTGKHLMPRFGFLSMIIDAWRRGARDDLQFVPVSIDYERIIEAGSYERELRGGAKKKEDVRGLLSTTRVLRSQYGRVHVQFGEPISLKEHAERRGLPQSDDPQHDDLWRDEVERFAYRVMHQVAVVSTVTPTAVVATALLGHPGRGIARSALVARCHEIAEYLDTALARLSDPLAELETCETAVLAAVQRLVDEGFVSVDRPGRSDAEPIFRVLEERRVGLDYYKNAVMNYFAPASIICRAIRRHGDDRIPYDVVHDDARFLSRLFKREFLYRADTSYDTVLDETLGTLAVRGMLDVHEDGTVEVREREPVMALAGLLDGFVEAYWVVLRTAADLRGFPLWKKELVTRAMERARRAFLEGEIRRPESAGRIIIEGGVGWLLSTGVVEASGGKKQTLKLSPEHEAGELEQLTERVAAFL
jgi:glycerol-3-phosphate O-acyltransferase